MLKRGTGDRQAAGIVFNGASDVTVVGNLFSGLHTTPFAVPGKPGTRVVFAGNVLTDVAGRAETLNNFLTDSVVENNLDPVE